MKKDYILNWLKNNLTEERYEHTLGTAECAKLLAQMFGEDPEKAEFAGLLHDAAKCHPAEKLLEIIKEKLSEIPECELLNYKTYHAPVGAYIAQNEFQVQDEEIINAIKYHTLGRVDMTKFEMIIFIADKIEARTRDKANNDRIWAIIKEKGLKPAMFVLFSDTIKSLVQRRLPICPTTIDVYNSLIDFAS
ncbi:bis(5'-nucleosyl)-tetraphosphatase (symmetrical) YqeK [bacterium]|nr:bis(5'-nucleosyl)-tetraphosphatase (symmetrical) YqeK [bacterium]